LLKEIYLCKWKTTLYSWFVRQYWDVSTTQGYL
jgi:hypothetical protein